jgi:CubicO group peptidase (beta-lactamase class C family)
MQHDRSTLFSRAPRRSTSSREPHSSTIKGRIVYEKAFGLANREWSVPNIVESRFEIASMTKPMTAIAIMQLVEEGKVRLDGHISDYLPFYPEGDR